ncbi:hypothetical protein LCGC14_2032810 [marine sediment metagenome]|uniref:Uncharacterized protein n=1 Tax=marine sediment metagenome TaxID=412755 RepID=A0A0F9HR47_9ZZZZ
MIRTTNYKPRSYPRNGTSSPVQIDRLQDMSASVTLNRTKLEELGRNGLVDWRVGNPTVSLTLRQLEYGTLEFFQNLANVAAGDLKIDFKDFDIPSVDIAAYETDENDSFKSTIWYPGLRLSGFSINIGDPDSLVERNFTLIGEDEITLQGSNAYLNVGQQTASGGSAESFTIANPTPVADPDNSGQFMFKVLRTNDSDGTTDKLKFEAGAGDPALGTDYYTYSGGTLKVHTSISDEVKYYYSAGAYISGEQTFTNNDTDAAGLEAKMCSVYLQTTSYLYRLQSVAVDVTLNRFDVLEIGDVNVVQRGVRDVTSRVTLGRILDQWTIEEVLRGEVAGYGKLDIRKFQDEKNLIIKIYNNDDKDSFRIGYKFTDLAPVGIDDAAPLNDYVSRGVTLEGESGFITSDENEL